MALPFRLIGSDGKEIAGTGGLDGFFRCSADGKNIEHIARGVWNPFSLCVLADGRIFAVDNDPDASPPCRLLHVVPGGDYGYLYQYGRAGTHPLQAGTASCPARCRWSAARAKRRRRSSPMPAACGSRVGAIIASSATGLCRAAHRTARRAKSSCKATPTFARPAWPLRRTARSISATGCCAITRCIGRGRIWRLVLPMKEVGKSLPERSNVDLLYSGDSVPGRTEEAPDWYSSSDPFIRTFGAWVVAHGMKIWSSEKIRGDASAMARWKLTFFQSTRLRGDHRAERICEEMLTEESPDLRLFAVRWIADERMTALRNDVAKLLEGPQPSTQYYLAVLAAVDWLDHEPSMRGAQIADELLVRELRNKDRSNDVRTLALRLLSPDHDFLSLERLRGYLQSKHEPLRLEALRSLSQRSDPQRMELLAEVAGDQSNSNAIRAEAAAGLAVDAKNYRKLLSELAKGPHATFRREAERSLRIAGLSPAVDEEKPASDDLVEWTALLSDPGDVEAGRRLFFNAVAARCGVCHQHNGRGGRIGPDLTHVGRDTSRERIIASILQPDQEIAPHYQAWTLITDDGKTHLGLKLPEGGDDGMEEYVDSTGRRFSLRSDAIESREAAATSIMPSGLEKLLSIADLRGLVTFLATESHNP